MSAYFLAFPHYVTNIRAITSSPQQFEERKARWEEEMVGLRQALLMKTQINPIK
jgi:hypothetical protein